MADTWRQSAIVQAIEIITNKKIAQAGFDKTIKGVINKVLDKTKGKYQIKYQDSLFEAYSTSSKIQYVKDQQVNVLIPNNDWDRRKTILNGVQITATNYQQIPIAGQQYNNIGQNGVSGLISGKKIQLSSYASPASLVIYQKGGSNNYINIRDISNYIKKGDSLALGMVVRTAFDPGQTGGNYGLRFNLVFKDNITGKQVIKTFRIDTTDVIGQPYLLTNPTLVEALIRNVDTQNFVQISSIQAFCDGFSTGTTYPKDIFITDVRINGASALTDQQLNGYVLHIDYSKNGNIIPSSSDQKTCQVIAQLKVNGKITTQNVKYYWFRQNSTIYQGNQRYSGYAGAGWECLNYKNNGIFVGKINSNFIFTNKADNFQQGKAQAVQKVNKILCVAVYDNKQWIKGQVQIINNNISNDILINSSDKINGVNRINYYLDNGHPSLICNSGLSGSGITYQWSVKPGRGNLVSVDDAVKRPYVELTSSNYNIYQTNYNTVINNLNKYAKTNARTYIKTADVLGKIVNFKGYQYYNKLLTKYLSSSEIVSFKDSSVYKNTTITYPQGAQNQSYISGSTYFNFPIKSISDYSTVYCAVNQNGIYRGTASITLYNKMQLEGMYSLNIENATQVFQYDGKGNSPTSLQVEKPIQILPLSFTLLDNQGKEISHDQIRKNGWIKWIIPNTQTLLSSVDNGSGTTGNLDLTVSRANLPLSANQYTVYTTTEIDSTYPLDLFNFKIADRYDFKKNINYIWLNVKFKDIVLDAYTDFSFPKDGDPGTNGTDYVAKIISGQATDRIYISSKNRNIMFNDNGTEFDKLKFQLYNNSKVTSLVADYWTTPPKDSFTINSTVKTDARLASTSYLVIGNKDSTNSTAVITGGTKIVSTTNINTVKSDKPVNIVRGQYGKGYGSGAIKYYAQMPICTQYITSSTIYRLKVRPKTGYKYVVYTSDGTSPDYDNSLPFEIVVEKYNSGYFEEENPSNYTFTWSTIGNFNTGSTSGTNGCKFSVTPKNNFDGKDLSSAIFCQVNNVGFIHIPIYMILNRYSNRALNGWDGSSLQLDKNGYGEVLTPQIGAGAKDGNNAFTGMLMGQLTLNSTVSSNTADIGKDGQIGIMGYDSGVRTLFLDAKTGKAEFGKNNQGKIIIDPDTIINGQAAALLYSNTYPVSYFLQHPNVQTVGAYYKNNRTAKGMLIDLSTPQIGFGNGNFTINSEGHLIARGGGEIAGWTLSDSTLYKSNVGLNSNSTNSSYNPNTAPNDTSLATNNGNMAIWAGSGSGNEAKNFYVTHSGYLYSKSGKIAKWNIDVNKLTDGNVGMGTNPNTINFTYYVGGNQQTASITDSRIWSSDKFVVTNGGKIYAKDGQISSWTIGDTSLTNGQVGLGYHPISTTRFKTDNTINARIWSGADNNQNFAVDNTGALYSRSGKIGGWNITNTQLWALNSNSGNDGIRIISDGSMNGGSTAGGTWSISADGTSTFNKIIANKSGSIAGWTINPKELSSPTNSMTIKSEGSLYGPTDSGDRSTWDIDKYGNANFKYIHGVIDTVNSSGQSQNGGTLSGGGGYGGGGYTLGGNGYFGVGSAGQGMQFSGGNLRVTGRIQAKEGYIGTSDKGWDINADGIVNGNNHIYNNEIVIGNSYMTTNVIAAGNHFSIGSGGTEQSKAGVTGVLTFDDGAKMYFAGGILYSVVGGEDTVWD